MENLDRIVADTLAQSGFETPVYLRPIPWSRWFRCESSFSLLLVPSSPGLYALAEEVAAPDEAPSAKRMLAVFEIGETEDLCLTLSRQFAPSSPLSARLATGRCFVRFARLHDDERRRMVCNSLKRWLAASAQTATGLANDASLRDIGIARDFSKTDGSATASREAAVPHAGNAADSRAGAVLALDSLAQGMPLQSDPVESPSSERVAHAAESKASDYNAHQNESRKAAAGDEPPPLPSGF
jgi:hypothetical protein